MNMETWRAFNFPTPAMKINSSLMTTILDRLEGVGPNSTVSDTSFQKVLPRVLDFFLPGYGFISNAILDMLGLDINLVLWVLVGIFMISKLNKVVLAMLSPIIDRCICDFTFDSDNIIYTEFAGWAREHGIGQGKRSVRVEIDGPNDDDDEDAVQNLKDFDPLSTTMIHTPPQRVKLMPSFGSHWFWHNHRLFRFSHVMEEKKEGDEIIRASVSCISLSNEPLKSLFVDLLQEAHKQTMTRTQIFWPLSIERRRYGFGSPWQRITTRQSRPMETIILDRTIKRQVLWDIAEFLTKDTARWYAERGLPYRRGYLFCGAPGTGKTSFSFAIAGMFRLPIYILSLQDPAISESDLMTLFNKLPRRCVMILEDIDSAGIKNRGSAVKKKEKEESRPSKRNILNDELDNRISLSGLLNVIDGIASMEGRILVMTTNAMESLDPALIRPGRIDLTIKFELLSCSDAKELFTLMYQVPTSSTKESKVKAIDAMALETLANQFANRIPEKAFSAAEVQGYLVTHKHDPQGAVDGIESWIVETTEKKKVEEQKRKELELEANEADQKAKIEDEGKGENKDDKAEVSA